MPIRGTKPTEQPARRRNRPTHGWTDVVDVPFEGGPSLPRTSPGQPTWPTATKRWWKAVSQMPHCVLWHPSDWEFAISTAILSAHFHSGNMTVAAELRQRERIIGTTLDARRDLRIRYVPGAPEEERAGLVAIAEYRKRLEA